MLIDSKQVLCEAFDLGAGTTTAGSETTNVLDLGIGTDAYGNSQTPDISNDGEQWLNLICDGEDFAGASATVTYDLNTSTLENMSSATAVTTFKGDETPNDGDVIANIPIPAGTTKRYMNLKITSTATQTAGFVSAFITNAPVNP